MEPPEEEYGLSNEAKHLLVCSYRAQLHQGRIFRLDTTTGTVVDAGRLRRVGLAWRVALDELENKGLVQRKSEQMYELTGDGVAFGATLSVSPNIQCEGQDE